MTSGKRKRRSKRLPSEREIKWFEEEVGQCMEDLDWSLQMLELTLQDAEYTEEEIMKRMRKVFEKHFWRIIGKYPVRRKVSE